MPRHRRRRNKPIIDLAALNPITAIARGVNKGNRLHNRHSEKMAAEGRKTILGLIVLGVLLVFGWMGWKAWKKDKDGKAAEEAARKARTGSP